VKAGFGAHTFVFEFHAPADYFYGVIHELVSHGDGNSAEVPEKNWIGNLKHAPALLALQMLVRVFQPVDEFVVLRGRSAGGDGGAEYAAVGQQGDGAVHRGLRYPVPGIPQANVQVIHFEMCVGGEDVLENVAPLGRHSHSP